MKLLCVLVCASSAFSQAFTPQQENEIRTAVATLSETAPPMDADPYDRPWSGSLLLKPYVQSIQRLSPNSAVVQATQRRVGSMFIGQRTAFFLLRRIDGHWSIVSTSAYNPVVAFVPIV